MLRLHVLSKGLNRQADRIIEGAQSSGEAQVQAPSSCVVQYVHACVVSGVCTGRHTVCRARCPAPGLAALLAYLLRAISKHTSSQNCREISVNPEF
jgi:hypothetical protein